MEKNKLGIVINTTKANNRTSGFRSIYRFNDDEWSSVIRDTGAELKKVTNNSTSAPIHLIQFESNGCCYCIMQSIAGRKDYQSAWIFIHKDILLPKGELSSIIQKVEEVLSLDVEDKKTELDKLFGKHYPTTNNPSYSVSSGDTYAVRYYGKGTDFVYERNSVLDDYLYQSEYCKYKSVFLIDKESGLQVSDVQDLSNTKLEKIFVIELPSDRYGFKHNWGADSLRVTEGAQVGVRWTRSGYAPVDKQGRCSEDLLIQKTDMKRSFRLDLFQVVDKVTKKELPTTIHFYVWYELDTTGKSIFFKEEDLTKASYIVELETYVTSKGELDLTSPNEQGLFIIELQPEEHIYNCSLRTNIPDCPEVEFSIHTQYKLTGKEIPGLIFKGKPSETKLNRLEGNPQQISVGHKENSPTPYGDNKDTGRGERDDNSKHASWYKYALLIMVILGILGGVCYYFFFYDKEDKVTVVDNYQDELPETEWEKAFDYLKEHETYWEKTGMESFSELKGVYTMIKDYQFKKLKSFIENHKEELLQLDSWSRLYDKIQNCNDKKGSFRASDDKIDIEKYLSTDFNTMEDVPKEETAPELTEDDISATDEQHNSTEGSSSHVPKTTSPGGKSDNTSGANTNNQDSNT